MNTATFHGVVHGSHLPVYFVDLPGYGYARGGRAAAVTFDALTSAYFERGGAAGLLLVDSRHQELWSIVASGLDHQEIRVPLGKGVAGRVAQTGETVAGL